jgi:hypothetical protein
MYNLAKQKKRQLRWQIIGTIVILRMALIFSTKNKKGDKTL